MGWDVDDTGLGVVFDRSIPAFVTERMAAAVDTALGGARDKVDRFVCHPGGAKVLTALESALDLGQGALNAEREVLRAAGNMSAPTVLFVLDRVLSEGTGGRMVATALAPQQPTAGARRRRCYSGAPSRPIVDAQAPPDRDRDDPRPVGGHRRGDGTRHAPRS